MNADRTLVLLVRPASRPPSGGDVGYRAWCPDLPGWYATGDSIQEAADSGAQIVRSLMRDRVEDGEAASMAFTTAIPVAIGRRAGGGRGAAGDGPSGGAAPRRPEEAPAAPTVRAPEPDQVAITWQPIAAGRGRGWDGAADEEVEVGDGVEPFTRRDVPERRAASEAEAPAPRPEDEAFNEGYLVDSNPQRADRLRLRGGP